MYDLKNRVTVNELEFLGFRLSAKADEDDRPLDAKLDIERILFKICIQLHTDRFDGRLASVLMSWMKVHGDRLHIERLSKMRQTYCERTGCDALWLRYFAYYNLSIGRAGWRKVAMPMTGANTEELHVGDDPHMARELVKRWGLETFLPPNCKLKVHKGALRVRTQDVLTVPELMKRNGQYRNRFLYGANVRCDVVTHIDSGHFKNPAELSSFLHLSRAAVSNHWRDYERYMEVTGAVSAN